MQGAVGTPNRLGYQPIVVVGGPGVGKTSVVQRVSHALSMPASEEVGGICRCRWGSASNLGERFDYYVMLSEFANDTLLGNLYPGHPVLVEQWHFGNLAHAQTRSSPVYEAYLEAIKHYCNAQEVPCIWLTTDEAAAADASGTGRPPNNCRMDNAWEKAFAEVVSALGLFATTVTADSVLHAADRVATLLAELGYAKT